jgi:glycosyltransferase involved in cell wall biosynthesis
MPRSSSVAVISSFVPRQCGIATFANDLVTNLSNHVHDKPLRDNDDITIAAMNDEDGDYLYGPNVGFEIRQHQRTDYRNAADFLNTGDFDVVNLQHEYGLFGGPDGTHVVELLERLKKPVVSTFHTVLSEPSEGQRKTLAAIAEASTKVVVLAERAVKLCCEVYGMAPEKVTLVHHGTPDVEFHDPDDFKAKFLVKGRPVILTFGLLGPSKGIETMLDALAIVARKHPDVAYMILGATHPHIKRESGESYRVGLETRAVELGIERNIFFHNHYVTLPVLVEFLKSADLYVTPYRSKEQIVSGTLAFAVSCGKAIVSTPYWYAQEMLADGRGCLADFESAESLAENINHLLDDDVFRKDVQKKAYAHGRQMIWPEVAKRYDDVFKSAMDVYRPTAVETTPVEKPGLHMTLPEVKLDHLHRLSDDTGMLQHAVYATPNRNHGYCTDDNARALLVASMGYQLLRDKSVLPSLNCYLSFMHYAWNEERKRFRNFMSYDRRWLDEDGTDDCQARCVWALGYLISHPPDQQDLSLAIDLFNNVSQSVSRIESPRAQAMSLIGFHYYLRSYGDSRSIRSLMQKTADSVLNRFEEVQSPDWLWLEDVLSYANARIPQGLILAGRTLNDSRYMECGLNSLEWLIEMQIKEGHLSPIGNRGWWRRGQEKAQFDQQPIEAASLIGACKSAYKATDDPKWLNSMRMCFEWFIGRNDIEKPLVDFNSRGCGDGLGPDRINPNQGAESTLCWLLALLTMYEMAPPEPRPEKGRPKRNAPRSR